MRRVLVAEYIVAIGFVSWLSIKNHYWPWPGTLVKIGVSFVIFALIAEAAPEFAAAMAGGVMLAAWLKWYQESTADAKRGYSLNGARIADGGVPNIGNEFDYSPLMF